MITINGEPAWQLFKDGKRVHLFRSELDMWKWLHRQHGYSVAHAFKYAGYTALQPDETPYVYEPGR
jgi:hypothetical protein